MKAFILGVAAAIGIAVVAYFALNSLDWSSAERFSAPSVRL
jgi:hypothetical protein